MAVLDQEDIEDLCCESYAEAGLDPSEPAHPIDLARAHPLIKSVRFILKLPELASLEWADAEKKEAVISIRLTKSHLRHGWLVSHELAEAVLEKKRPYLARPEREANRLAAAQIAPRLALAKEVKGDGIDLPTLAAVFNASELTMALRLGEAMGYGVAVIGGLYIPRRGQIRLPPDNVLRVWVDRWRNGGVVPGVRFFELTDTPDNDTVVAVTDDRG